MKNNQSLILRRIERAASNINIIDDYYVMVLSQQ